jgi:hypothetical protein
VVLSLSAPDQYVKFIFLPISITAHYGKALLWSIGGINTRSVLLKC